MSARLTLYGPTVSTFTRICAMAAAEAGLDWDIIPTASGSTEMAAHHPFMRAPAAYIDGLHIYESPPFALILTVAIMAGRCILMIPKRKRVCGNGPILPPIMCFR